MKKTLAAIVLAALTGSALADPRETQTRPGPYGTYFDDTNPANTTLAASFNGSGYSPVGVRIEMDLESVTPFSWAQDVTVTCIPPAGPAFNVVMSNVGEYTTLTDVTSIVAFPAGVDPVGAWSFILWDAFQDGDGSMPESNASNVRLSLEGLTPPAPVVDMGTLGSGVSFAGDNLEEAGVSWFKFTLPAANDLGNPRYIDITTNGSDFDSVVMLYNSQGRAVRMDDEDGEFSASFLSFGYGGGATTGEDENFEPTVSDGRDGKLAAGAYYLAIVAYADGSWNFGLNLWAVTASPVASEGTVTVVISIGDTPPPGGTPPPAVDVGGIGVGVLTATVAIDQPGAVKWLKFTAGTPFGNANGRYLDIDTIGTSLAMGDTLDNDTEIAVYTAEGLMAAADDDDGPVWLSALSFGAATPVRDALGSGLPGNGRDGGLPAGVYYLGAAVHDTVFTNNFSAPGTGTTTGTIAVNFRSNNAVVIGCSNADIGVQGGTPGRDNRLDNNDFIVYINQFFAQDPAADLGVTGGTPGSDGAFDNNDFIVFINIFFTDGPNCTG